MNSPATIDQESQEVVSITEANKDIQRLTDFEIHSNTLNNAISSGAGDEIIKLILQGHASHVTRVSKQKFNIAFCGFQREVEVIFKNGGADFPAKGGGRVSYDYAKLEDIINVIRPMLGTNGLSFRHESNPCAYDNRLTSVTCTVMHEDGYETSATESGELDDTGSKNDIQKRGSTSTYLRRYSLLAALGLAPQKGDDDDGHGGSSAKPSAKKEAQSTQKPPYSDEQFKAEFAEIKFCIEKGKKTAQNVINKLSSKYTVSQEQKDAYKAITEDAAA